MLFYNFALFFRKESLHVYLYIVFDRILYGICIYPENFVADF